ncbi:MAG: selenocysteine-specific translation elongation factor [Acidimicrobiales bacterium]
MHVVATAGHVDHGKSTLVRSLTGIDPDRFAEEKERGLTIDLGFAWATLPSGRELSFVDVPGHVRFIKNMLAGVGAVDACLFVVAATEGWKPQSEEHLRILQLLGVSHGLIALTKAALVDSEWLELAELDVADRVAGTFLDNAPVVVVDAPTGYGIDKLTLAIDDLLADTPSAADRHRPRLWVDRSFAAKGAGTVVTGTLTGGELRLDQRVSVLPSGLAGRVRSLQTNQATLDAATPGRRLAVNISGIDHSQIARGDAVVLDGQWAPTTTFDAELTVLATVDHDVGRRGAYTAYVGAGAYSIALRLVGGRQALTPGETGWVRVHLPVALPLLPGDRFVVRETGRGETVGGGEVLDVAPVRRAAEAAPDRSIDRVIAERGWIEVDDLERLTGERVKPTIGGWVVAPTALKEMSDALRQRIDEADTLGLDIATLDDRERALLPTLDGITLDAGRATAGSGTIDLSHHPYLQAVIDGQFAPPTPDEAAADRGEVRELVRHGLLIERDGLFFAPEVAAKAAQIIATLLATCPEGVTASAIREAVGTSRKYLLPLLGHLDASGVTRRRGDVRIAGPRLPAVDAD